jgi:hypothetical protein
MKVRLESLRTTSITLITRCRHGDTSAWEEGVYAGTFKGVMIHLKSAGHRSSENNIFFCMENYILI